MHSLKSRLALDVLLFRGRCWVSGSHALRTSFFRQLDSELCLPSPLGPCYQESAQNIFSVVAFQKMCLDATCSRGHLVKPLFACNITGFGNSTTSHALWRLP